MSNPTMEHEVDLPLSLRTWCDPAVGARLSNRAADEIERLREENRRLLTGDRVVYFPCKEHMGLPWTMTVGFAPPTMCKCPICDPPPSPLSASEEPK